MPDLPDILRGTVRTRNKVTVPGQEGGEREVKDSEKGNLLLKYMCMTSFPLLSTSSSGHVVVSHWLM